MTKPWAIAWASAATLGALGVIACGIGLNGLEAESLGRPDAARPPIDAGVDRTTSSPEGGDSATDTSTTEDVTPPMEGGSLGVCVTLDSDGDADGGCFLLPDGGVLVAFAANPSMAPTTCPTDFSGAAPMPLYTNPATNTQCSCNDCVLTSPVCPSGKISYQTNGTCAATMDLQLETDGGCVSQALPNNDHFLINPPSMAGTCSCTASATVLPADWGCPLSNGGCASGTCTVHVSDPFEVCILVSDPSQCPSSLSQQHTVGVDAGATCSSCDCSATQSCTGAFKTFTDSNCQNAGVLLVADGGCDPSNPSGQQIDSYEFVPNQPSPTLTPGTTSYLDGSLVNPEILCCPQ